MWDSERQILISLWDRWSKRPVAHTVDELQAKLVDLFRTDAVQAVEVLPAIAAAGLVRETDAGWTLTKRGCQRAPELGLAHFKRIFEETYELALVSETWNHYCERVYGGALAQLDMLTVDEIDDVAALLEVGPGDRVVDLGCGAGMIAERLARRTGAHVTGLDYSEAAIRQARGRDAGGVSFEVADLDQLALEPGAWNAAVAIDTLYFVADLRLTVERILAGLRPGARFVAYFTVFLQAGQRPGDLGAGATALGRALSELGVAWTAVDQTEMQRGIFERSLAAIDELRPAFEAEGNHWLLESRVEEAVDTLARHEAGETRRYRYLATAPT